MSVMPPDNQGNMIGYDVPRCTIGFQNIIYRGAQIATGVSIGSSCIIENDVTIGSNTRIGNRVVLKSGTVIGENCDLADGVMTTGPCRIGNNVNIRTGAVISRCTILEDKVFVGPCVVTNHTKHVTHCREGKSKRLITTIGYGSIVGSQAAIVAGIYVAPLTIIGAASLGVKDIREACGVYMGAPWERVAEIPNSYLLELPDDAGGMYRLDHDRLLA